MTSVAMTKGRAQIGEVALPAIEPDLIADGCGRTDEDRPHFDGIIEQVRNYMEKKLRIDEDGAPIGVPREIYVLVNRGQDAEDLGLRVAKVSMSGLDSECWWCDWADLKLKPRVVDDGQKTVVEVEVDCE